MLTLINLWNRVTDSTVRGRHGIGKVRTVSPDYTPLSKAVRHRIRSYALTDALGDRNG